jgi:succinate dehydrogenase/fumarate reductase flavoprotein subunit
MLLSLLACVAVPGTHSPVKPAGATDDTSVEWADAYDVVVVGSGPAGIAAALTARASGATVLVLDRDTVAGRGLTFAGYGFAAGTHWQAELGIVDSPAIAAAEWAGITGADPASGGVTDFLDRSAETLDWLESYGMTVLSVGGDPDGGEIPRIHTMGWTYEDGDHPLVLAFDGDLRTEVEVTAPVMEDGRIVGVRWTDLVTGDDGATRAGAVVIATGGFMRDLDEIERVKPGTLARHPVFETNPQSNGGGLPFLRAVGAGSLFPGNLGIYVHSIEDPWLGAGESLLGLGVERAIIVGADGERFVNEAELRSFDLFDALPEGDVYEVFTDEVAAGVSFTRPGYNWSVPDAPEFFSFEETLAASEDIFTGGSADELALSAGIDPAGLSQTVEDWNDTIAVGGSDPFGHPAVTAASLEGDTWYAVRLSPGLAKNFGGVATDVDAHVLDAEGAPIPGLYAAGEVVGMVLGGGGGDGFTGSVNACYYGGRVAGANAAGGV